MQQNSVSFRKCRIKILLLDSYYDPYLWTGADGQVDDAFLHAVSSAWHSSVIHQTVMWHLHSLTDMHQTWHCTAWHRLQLRFYFTISHSVTYNRPIWPLLLLRSFPKPQTYWSFLHFCNTLKTDYMHSCKYSHLLLGLFVFWLFGLFQFQLSHT